MSRAPDRRFGLALVLVVAGAAALRGLHLWEQARDLPVIFHPVLDARLYHQWALSLARGAALPAAPYYHAPGYPEMLGLLYGILGPSPVAAIVVQSLLGVATTALVALTARRLFGTVEAIAAAILFVAYGPVYFFEAKLLAATVSVFLSMLVVALAVQVDAGGDRGPLRRWGVPVLLGLGAGVLAVVRANLALAGVLLVCVFAVRAWRGSLPWRVPLVVAAAAVTAVLPTAVHNLAHGAFAPIATNGGFNFYAGNVRGAQGIYTDVGGISGVIRTQEAEADSLVRADLGRTLPPGEESRYWFRRGLHEIAADPLGWLALVGRKALLLVQRDPVTVNGSYPLEAAHVFLYRLAALPFNLLLGLGVLGWILAARSRARPPAGSTVPPTGSAAPLTGPVVLLAAVLVSGLLFFVMERLRLPAVPVLSVFAGYALVTGVRRWRPGTRLPVVLAAVVVIVFTGATWKPPLGLSRNPGWESGMLLQVGNACVEAGETDRAMRAYALAEAADPTALKPLQAQSQIAMERGDLEAALRVLERAAVVAPGDSAVRSNLGIAYLAAGNLDGCLREMTAAARLAPGWGVPLYYQGLVLRRRGDPRAASLFMEALERDPRIQGAYTELIDLLVEEGQMDAAREWVERASANGVTIPPELRARVP
jgi:tetratricopeptide (TPR) repeat protein